MQFDLAVSAVIMLNLAVLCTKHWGQSRAWDGFHYATAVLFTGVYFFFTKIFGGVPTANR